MWERRCVNVMIDDDWIPLDFTPGPDAIAINPYIDAEFVKKPFLGFNQYTPKHRRDI
jgi:hypothetical protein